MKGDRLPLSFYLRDDVVQISKELLGKRLVTEIDGERCAGLIVETEAYRSSDDKACHAYNDRRTARTKVMYRRGGHAYVYLCYGLHHLFNVVTGDEGQAQAVLIRAVEPIENVETMLQRRGFRNVRSQLTAGPGVMSKALGITTKFTGINMLSEDSPIWIEYDEPIKDQIIASPRVGIDYAEECALWNWRFRLKNSSWTS